MQISINAISFGYNIGLCVFGNSIVYEKVFMRYSEKVSFLYKSNNYFALLFTLKS